MRKSWPQGPGLPSSGEGLSPFPPYIQEAWAELLGELGLEEKYPQLIWGLANGFDLGIPRIGRTYSPPNHSSVSFLPDVYSNIVDSEFKAGRYIGPFM